MIAIGGSAGALRSLEVLLAGLPAGFRSPILVALHLDPGHPSTAVALLQKNTVLIVEQAVSGRALLPGHVYVAPPDHHLELEGDVMRLTSTARVHFARPSLDRLFISLAKRYGRRAIALILSGSGSDGSAGVVAVKAAGGQTVAEANSSAQQAAMPLAAIQTGAIDIVLPAPEMAAFLVRPVSHRGSADEHHWSELLELLKKAFGTDFSVYRQMTLRRRLQRRMAETGEQDLVRYLRLVAADPSELRRLHDAFLIKVSSFLRDGDHWDTLYRKVLKPLCASAPPGHEVRAWSAGCATGEEAYTLAMLLKEASAHRTDITVKVLATDIDEKALAVARAGLYRAPAVKGLSARRLRAHFTADKDGWRVGPELRSLLTFGRHDLMRDPPFTGLDVIACRNLLIYVQPAQKKVAIARLTGALRQGGHLFLGKSESLPVMPRGMRPLAGAANLFERTQATGALPARGEKRKAHGAPKAQGTGIEAALLKSRAAIVFGMDGAHHISLWNQGSEDFFGLPASQVLGRPALKRVMVERLAKAMETVEGTHRAVQVAGLAFEGNDQRMRYMDLDCLPGSAQGGPSFLFVGCDVTSRHQAEVRAQEMRDEAERAAQEATRANEALLATNEELASMNEEMQSNAEENQAVKDELQGRNEELETVNEELRSTNELVDATNREFRAVANEKEALAAYVTTLVESSPGTWIACTQNNTITYWSSKAARRFHISPLQALNKSLFVAVPALRSPRLRKAIAVTLATGATHSGSWKIGGHALDIEIFRVGTKAGAAGYLLRLRGTGL
ncbi:MAG: CheR family methyltransferase [Thermoplasmatota archaeon]